MIDMWADTDVQIDWLLERKPHYLTAYSSTLLALAERVQKRGMCHCVLSGSIDCHRDVG